MASYFKFTTWLTISGIFFIFVTACKNQRPSNISEDSDKAIEDLEIQRKADSLTQAVISEAYLHAYWDTVGVEDAPIKVISASLVKEEYSNYRNISLKYKNVSNKVVEGIRFRWYGTNAFNEPADMGNVGNALGFGSGFDDDPIGPGKIGYATWSIYSKDGKKVVKAWPYKVAFKDGTTWSSSTTSY